MSTASSSYGGPRQNSQSQLQSDEDARLSESGTPSTSAAEPAREPSAFYIPAKDGALVDWGEERIDKREALRRLEEHLEDLECGIDESFKDLEQRIARLRDDGSTRVLPELRDERQGLYRAVTQPGLEVQHATAVAGLDVATALSSASEAVASTADDIGHLVTTAVSTPIDHYRETVPAVKNITDGINHFLERTGEHLKPVADAVAVVQEGTARFFGLKETSATVYQPVPPTIPHVVRVAGAATVNNNFDNTAAPPDRSEKPVKYIGYSAPVKGLTENSVERQEKLARKWEGRDAQSVEASEYYEEEEE